MDSSGQELHPNWRALATCHIRLKRFVPASSSSGALLEKQCEHKSELQNFVGKEIQHFYEDLVQQESKLPKKIETSRGQINVQEEEVQKKINFNAQKFFKAATHNDVETIKTMNLTVTDINARDEYDWTALMMAACEGAMEVVQHLLILGVDTACREKSGKTAADLAEKKGLYDIAEIIRNHSLKSETEIIEVEDDFAEKESFYCDTCEQEFNETNQKNHLTSTLHKFCNNSNCTTNRLQKFNIPPRNRGLQLMLKQGWDCEHGLGPSSSGRLYPIKTVIRKNRTGLGVEQPPARVTHFKAFDLRATKSYKYKSKSRNRNDIKTEALRDWKRNRRLRKELS